MPITPLSPTANRVTLLLAGELGKKVIIALQWLGIEICRGAGKPPPE